MFSAGEVIGYDLGEELYASARTRVYRGIRKSDGLPVVLKILNREYPSAAELARIDHEYNIARSIISGGAARFYDFITIGHTRAIVMEDIGGITLHDYLRNYKPAVKEILKAALRATEAIGQIHQHSVIHKDISPENIIINPRTGDVRIIDYNISVRLQKETHAAVNPEKLKGTLAYISPEQTGRMNRTIDFRSDFYSFGATLYDLFTGDPPFTAENPAALIHSHMAIMPRPPHELNQEMPRMMSDIIMKLLSKTAGDRYQSAVGLRLDMERCLDLLESGNAGGVYKIGTGDISESLLIPEKLYGRDEEIQALLNGFALAAQGRPGMIFFTGPQGIGKSYLVNEIQKPLIRKRGYFASGKFDRLKRDVPYFAFIQAFQDIIRQMLTESEECIELWKREILEKVGSNARIVIDIVPELELLIGKQPPVPELNPAGSQNRFYYSLRSFIESLAGKEHPFVLFLDDLQWADSGSLQLLKMVVAGPGPGHMLLLGAYRDNEVTEGDPLMLLFDELKRNNGQYKSIKLQPLDTVHINEMVSETLFLEPDSVRELSTLVKAKTGGNPFFVKEFIFNLYRGNYIYFQNKWLFDLDRIVSANITDNVVLMMSDRVKQLRPEAQSVLKTASCIGVSFKLDLLGRLTGQSERILFETLSEAINEGMIIKSEDNYKFAHDRVRDAVYSLIEHDAASRLHYAIGKELLSGMPENKIEDAIFSIVYQLDLAAQLITDRDEKNRLARLNLTAGLKAKASTAYDAALQFFQQGIDLLPEDTWTTCRISWRDSNREFPFFRV